MEGERLVVQSEQEDECTLCELCLEEAPPKAITIRKTYKDEYLISRGGER
jgi:ferredoxin